jgi:acyl-CoA thioesterase FadM
LNDIHHRHTVAGRDTRRIDVRQRLDRSDEICDTTGMARLRLELPARFPFTTEIAVRITDINYGGHLGNDALLSLIHEARCRFFQHFGFKETDIAGAGILMVDAAIAYRKEAFHGDVLRFEVGATDLQRTGCDIVYRVTRAGDVVAEAKTGIVFFDYQRHKIVRMPPAFAALFTSAGSDPSA